MLFKNILYSLLQGQGSRHEAGHGSHPCASSTQKQWLPALPPCLFSPSPTLKLWRECPLKNIKRRKEAGEKALYVCVCVCNVSAFLLLLGKTLLKAQTGKQANTGTLLPPTSLCHTWLFGGWRVVGGTGGTLLTKKLAGGRQAAGVRRRGGWGRNDLPLSPCLLSLISLLSLSCLPLTPSVSLSLSPLTFSVSSVTFSTTKRKTIIYLCLSSHPTILSK